MLATAGASEGRGHLARALALAEAADEMGIATRIALSRGKPSAAELARALATGAVFTEAAELMQREGPFVVDLPDPNEVDLRRLSEATVFDDSELLGAPARVVVQPSVPVWTPSHGGSAATLLCGFAYAPLGRAVRAAIGTRTGGASWPPAVLLCFGGSDPADVTARVGRRLASDPRWRLEVVVGPDYRGTAEATGLGVIREPADLVERLVRADVAVIGAGTPRAAASNFIVPAVLVAVADDQVPVGPRFAAAGAAVWMGDGRHIDPEALAECVAAVAGDEVRRATMSRRGPEVVPGDGARRIVAETMADTGTEGAV